MTNEVYCFGYNRNGVLGFGHDNEIEEFTINEDLSDKQIIQFHNSWYHTIARTIDENIYYWDYYEDGVLGNGLNDEKIHKSELNKYLLNEKIIDISCGGYHTLVLTSNGEVYAWGANNFGQFGNNSNDDHVFILFKLNTFNVEKVESISCGWNHSMILT